ncbi:hypothetical protein G6O69_34235 [Pseudenhygromyxa sp. WMMC2535]|nr:hypothetical protein [Pseudenhygromyxa sp. WMMC2535]
MLSLPLLASACTDDGGAEEDAGSESESETESESSESEETETGESEETGSEETGSEETGSEESGSEETGSEETGSEETGSEETGTEETDTGETETGETDTGGEDPCVPQEAEGEGPCDQFFGWQWNGTTCVGQSGCECVGLDCDALYPDLEVCEQATSGCEVELDCDVDDAVGEGACDQFFGWAWDGLGCVGVSGCECVGADCDTLPLEFDTCVVDHELCNEVPPLCEPMDAAGVGACELFLGWAWKGMNCVGLSGCTCEGSDCDNLFEDLSACFSTCAE